MDSAASRQPLMRVVADACALGAIILQEDGWKDVGAKLDGASIHAPELLKYELCQIVLKRARRVPSEAGETMTRLAQVLDRRRGITWHDVNPVDVAILARLTGLSAYDASYLWLAGWLEADLVTLDKRLSSSLGLESERPF